MAAKPEAIMEDAVSVSAVDHCLKEETMVAETSSQKQAEVKPTVVKNKQLSKGQKRKNSQRFEKGIVSSTRPQNLTNHGGWRPKPINFRKMDPSKQLLVNGCQLTLRQCRSFVMFEIETFTVVISKSLPLRMSFSELHSMVALYAKARRPQMTAEAKAWRHEFLSWKSIKHFLEHSLHDQCVRDILRTYVPHDAELKFDGTMGLGDAPCTFLGSSETDFIKIAGVTIPFMVKCGKIYFDVFPAFTLMGQLQVALKSEWREIDSMLVGQGFNLRTTFRINTTPDGSYKTWRSQRSAVSYDAFKALIKSDIVPPGQRKERLMAILDHLDTDIMGLTRAREDLVNQLQVIVEDNIHLKKDSQDQKVDRSGLDLAADVLTGTEVCYRGCGRYYHYTIKCCTDVHKVKFSQGNWVKYIVQRGQLFFDKCTAFSLMNKISIVKHCDFRTVDRHLVEQGIELSQHFLCEHQPRDPEAAKVFFHNYGRRTHMSFEAFKALINAGLVDKKKEKDAKNFVRKISSKIAMYKSKCAKYEGKDRILSQSETTLDPEEQDEESSSSGIESGGISSCESNQSNSGKTSPVDQILEKNDSEFFTDRKEFVEKVLDDKFELHLSIDNNHLYCDVRDFTPFVGVDYDLLVKILKRKYRSVDVPSSFRSRMFHAPVKGCFFSVKCFKLLFGKNYIKKVGPGINKANLVKELDDLLEKYDTKEDEELEEDDEDCTNLMTSDTEDNSNEVPDSKVEDLKTISETENKIAAEDVGGQPMIKICDSMIPYQVKERNIFLERKVLLNDLFFVQSQQKRNYQMMDQVLTQAGCNLIKSFIWFGKNRKFISIPAVKILIKQNYYALKKPELKQQIDQSLDKLTKEKSNLLAKKVLHLPSFEDTIPYKLSRGTVFLNTSFFLKTAGCSQKYVERKPSNSYFTVLRLLKKQGINVKGCFLKQGICKYGYISTKAAFLLFKSEKGPFRNKKRMKLLRKELHEALKSTVPAYTKKSILESNQNTKDQDSGIDIVADTITIGDIKVKYQIKNGSLYFHRMTVFEAIGLEKALILNYKGLPAVNRILTSHKLEVAKSYLKSPDEQYGFISFTALWTILDAEDPLVTMLEKRSSFASQVMSFLHTALCQNLKQNCMSNKLLFDAIPCMVQNGKFMVHKAKTVAYSGLYDKAHLLSTGVDFITLNQLMKFSRLESDQQRSSGYSNFIWTDMISAVMHETPKLRVHVKLMDFREKLMQFLENELSSYLSKPDSVRSDNSPMKVVSNLPTVDQIKEDPEKEIVEKYETEEETLENLKNDDILIPDVEMVTNEEDLTKNFTPVQLDTAEAMSLSEFTKIQESVGAIRSGLIGDWHVKRCDSSEVRLIVNPGYGASKKISFVQPDVSAILKYELCLRPNEPAELTINDLEVPNNLVESIFKRDLQRGLYGLLYNLLTMRPCFGNFQPELVETLEKRRGRNDDSESIKNQDLIIDTNFIGSSQNGRTYAGTVRSKQCSVLATSKVSDMCNACSSLQCCVVINRSVLASPVKKGLRTMSQESSSSTSSNASSEKQTQQQQSVWKVENSSVEGCTFLCPQLQSYNTSLPHQFVSSSQASSVVEHRVYIAQDLSLKLSLNNKEIVGKKFQEFEKNKQVGPLLDNVASMRMCVGYPDPVLLTEARYLIANKIALPNEIKKFFDYITVDESFNGKLNGVQDLTGTMRANSCRFVASDHADICDQCRLLQEPLNFLGFSNLISDFRLNYTRKEPYFNSH